MPNPTQSRFDVIVGFRNRIIRGYDAIDHAAVWGVIQGHLPHLLAQIDALLAETGSAWFSFNLSFLTQHPTNLI